MRKYGTDAPEFFIFQLEGSEEVYKIPIAASMPLKHLMKMKGGFEGQVEMLRAYMGDTVDDIPAGTLGEILEAWSTYTKEQGASVGESSASSD